MTVNDPSNDVSATSSADDWPSDRQGPRKQGWWVRLVIITAVLLLPLLCVISQPAAYLLSHVGGNPFSQFPTPTITATLPPSVVLHNHSLHLPVLAAGNPCPVSATRTIEAGATVMGVGPVYLVTSQDTVYFAPAQSQSGQGWGAGQLSFAVHNSLHGLVLVRGRQLDGPHDVRFGLGQMPDTELLFRTPADSRINLDQSSLTYAFDTIRLFEAGCYALQVDSEQGSDVIVFRAEPQQASSRPA